MTKKSFLNATIEAIVEEMERDERVFIMGQDLRTGTYGAFPLDRFGDRVRNLPISEAANVGAAVGAALTGMRPVIDMTVSTFLYSGMDQIVNQAAKSRYMFGGQADVPVVIRATMFYGASQAAHHTDRPYPMFMNVPGLKIIVPSTAADAKGLMKSAIREPDPVMVFEDSNLWGTRSEVPDDVDFIIPLGKADIKQEGDDVTIVAIANGVRYSLQAAKELSAEGISAEVLDPRTLVPMDWDAIFASVRKTGRLVVVDPAFRTCGAASEIVTRVVENCYDDLKVAPVRVTAPDMQVPFSPGLEKEILPNKEKVLAAVHSILPSKAVRV
ncbi:MAG: transketolase C-terminal domain-containing protein [Mycetocola sp.]